MADVTIIDYGMGNIGSVVHAFSQLGATSEVVSDPRRVHVARAIVLPGVGAFPAAMENLHSRHLVSALTSAVVGEGKPFLGICLGLQLIAEDSVEGGLTKGLGWVKGHVLKLKPATALPVPHVGWNEVAFSTSAPLFSHLGSVPHFYFDHGFALECGDSLATASCDYGGRCVAAIQHRHIHAVQFHPEKSQRNGLRILRNFLHTAAC